MTDWPPAPGMTNHCLRVAASPEQVLVQMDVPIGEPLDWDPPQESPVFKWDAVGELEHVIDGVVVRRGVWPNLEPVDGA
jgi:hypothetical protein